MTQKEALDILKMGGNVFLTGPAGSGKTFVLNEYIKYLKSNNVSVAVTASTGIAATHLSGVTIHSFTGLGIRDSLTDRDIEDLIGKEYLHRRFEKTRVLIIDEISMLSSDTFTMVEWICRSFKRNDMPFGGMQVILCGDFFQLPPINKNNNETSFAYQSDIWEESDFSVCYLSENHRHEDIEFLEILHKIRKNKVDQDVITKLNGRLNKEIDGVGKVTKLFSHNVEVDTINSYELSLIKEEEREYKMLSKGKDFLIETLKKSCLAPEFLKLKVSAKVMFVKNNYEAGFVNGTIGEVVGFNGSDLPVVRISSGKKIEVSALDWSIEEDGKVKASVSQLPLRLAWAITVHKSQGMSLDHVEIDLSKSFVEGMGYVALSRVRTLSGMKLLGINDKALMVNNEVLIKDIEFQKLSELAVFNLREKSLKEKDGIQRDFLDMVSEKVKKEKEFKESTVDKTKRLIEDRLPLKEIASMRNLKQETIVSHLEELLERGEDIDIGYLKKEFKYKELEEILEAFRKTNQNSLSPVYNLLQKQKKKPNYFKLRLARLFL